MNINRLDFHISYQCVNRCVFCSEKSRLSRFRGKNLTPAEIKNVLVDKSRQGFEYVTFTGGEPTLVPTLPFALKLSKLLKFRTCVTTNGYGFADCGFCHEILPYCDEIMLSMHGDCAEVHDKLSGRNGSYRIFEKALENMSSECASGNKKGLFLMTNTVLTTENAHCIESMYRKIVANPYVRQCLLSYPAPEGMAYHNYSRLALPPDEAGQAAAVAAEILVPAGRMIRFFGFPACHLGVYAKYSNDFYWSPRITVERGIKDGRTGLRETVSERPVRRRHYDDKCSACSYRNSCGGFFNAVRE